MYKIILDTNFIISALKFKVNIFSELERICNFEYSVNILDKTLDELEKLINQHKINQTILKLIIALIKAKKIEVIKTKGRYVDKILLNQKEVIIATQDKALKSNLKNKPHIIIRQKNKLELRCFTK